jgi:hypothetical protein
MHAPAATAVAIPLPTHTHTLTQSPALLRSSHAAGTTGAVLWSITPPFARYLLSARRPAWLTPASAVLELGCGVAAVLAAGAGRTVRWWLQTDSVPGVLKLARANLAANLPASSSAPAHKAKGRAGRAGRAEAAGTAEGRVGTAQLDWERDDVASQPWVAELGGRGLTAVVACDCVYNEALVGPFVDTVRAGCLLNGGVGPEGERTLAVVALEVRAEDVVECFLDEMMARGFEVWRVPGEMMGEELAEELGRVVFVGRLKE